MRNGMKTGYPHRAIVLLVSMVFAFVTTVASAQQPPTGTTAPPTPPLIREGATVKLTDHVWAIPDFNVGLVPNVGIVVGSKATLVVDTGLGPRNGEAIVREMKKLAPTPMSTSSRRITTPSTHSARRPSRAQSC